MRPMQMLEAHWPNLACLPTKMSSGLRRVALLCCFAVTLAAPPGFPASGNGLWYTTPGSVWSRESLPIGNGYLAGTLNRILCPAAACLTLDDSHDSWRNFTRNYAAEHRIFMVGRALCRSSQCSDFNLSSRLSISIPDVQWWQ